MSNPYDEIEHSNEDDLDGMGDIDYDEVQQMVDDQIVRNQLPQIRQLDDLLGNERFRVEKGDPKTNVWEQGGKYRMLHISREDVSSAFNLMNAARKQNIKSYWTEKQLSGQDPKFQAVPACIMLDFDIYQTNETSGINEKNMHRFQHELNQLFMRIFQPPQTGKEQTVFSAVFKRAKITYDEGKKAYKDGYHIAVYARLTRDEKRFLLNEIFENKILTKSFGKDLTLAENNSAEKILDTACCHVPILMYGSVKAEATLGPYRLWMVYQWRIEDDGICFLQRDEQFVNTGDTLNHMLELSYNFDGRLIKKTQWTIKAEYRDRMVLMNGKAGKNTSDGERQALLDDMHALMINDPDAEYLKNVLECLKPERYNNRQLWFKVVYALVKNNERFIPLAKWFSKKSHKYTEAGFVQVLEDVWKSDYNLNHENIYSWASKDSPEKFKACGDRSCFLTMSKFVFDSIVEGKLNHAHYAELIWLFLKNKYKTDMRGNKRIWYEFIFPGDPQEKGQVYKWCEIPSPDTLDMYLHRKLSELCNKMVKYLNKKLETARDKVIAKKALKVDHSVENAQYMYFNQIIKNYKSSARGLWADGFKGGILKQAEKVFQEKGFARGLDQGEMDLGVGNGVLVLSWEGKLPKLVKSYNTYKVSRYTSTPYKQFDPRDPLTRKLLKGLRSGLPDDETDAFEYKMAFKAATLDNRPRETIILMITGPGSNGKSFEFELHAATMGEMYCAQMPIAMLLNNKEDNGEAPKPFMMRLESARCAYYEEGPTMAVLYMPIIKRITGCGNLPARNLFEQARTIKSRCYHFVLSNHDFIVISHEEAVWRRLRYLYQSVIFKDELDFDPNNPKHRLMDRSFNAQFIEDESTRSAYLSIMTFYHMKLMRFHGGIIEHVPHPTVDQQTMAFRNRQDTINRFITERVVVSPQTTTPTTLDRVVELYCLWYDTNIRAVKHFRQEIFKQFLDSALKDVISQTSSGDLLQAGFRILESATDIQEGETLFRRGAGRTAAIKKYSQIFPTETPDQFLDRVEREWETLLRMSTNDKIDLTKTYEYDEDDGETEDSNFELLNKKRADIIEDINEDQYNAIINGENLVDIVPEFEYNPDLLEDLADSVLNPDD
jgi:phage/plasmid-associated DNA primase